MCVCPPAFVLCVFVSDYFTENRMVINIVVQIPIFCLSICLFSERFGLAARRYAGKQRDLGSNPHWLYFLFKRCGLWTLSCDFVPHNK